MTVRSTTRLRDGLRASDEPGLLVQLLRAIPRHEVGGAYQTLRGLLDASNRLQRRGVLKPLPAGNSRRSGSDHRGKLDQLQPVLGSIGSDVHFPSLRRM